MSLAKLLDLLNEELANTACKFNAASKDFDEQQDIMTRAMALNEVRRWAKDLLHEERGTEPQISRENPLIVACAMSDCHRNVHITDIVDYDHEALCVVCEGRAEEEAERVCICGCALPLVEGDRGWPECPNCGMV